MKRIALTKQKVTIVDDEDYEFLTQWRWQFHSQGYASRNIKPKTIWMHRLILKTPEGYETDHINGNKLDNRKQNLRIATHAQNNRRKGLQKSNKWGYKGITKVNQKSGEKWFARLWFNNKSIWLGGYKTKEEAASAYNKGAKKYHKKFAQLNEIKTI